MIMMLTSATTDPAALPDTAMQVESAPNSDDRSVCIPAAQESVNCSPTMDQSGSLHNTKLDMTSEEKDGMDGEFGTCTTSTHYLCPTAPQEISLNPNHVTSSEFCTTSTTKVDSTETPCRSSSAERIPAKSTTENANFQENNSDTTGGILQQNRTTSIQAPVARENATSHDNSDPPKTISMSNINIEDDEYTPIPVTTTMQWKHPDSSSFAATDALNNLTVNTFKTSNATATATASGTCSSITTLPVARGGVEAATVDGQSGTSRTVSANTIHSSTSQTSLTGQSSASSASPTPPPPPPPSSQGQTGTSVGTYCGSASSGTTAVIDHSSIGFSASGFNNVINSPQSTEKQESQTQQPHQQMQTSKHPVSTHPVSSPQLAQPMSMETLTPVNSSNNLSGVSCGSAVGSPVVSNAYTFSPGSFDPAADSCRKGSSLKQHRQKRLERNRESARLSRRRRKQYLEVLEERVSTLSEQMDRGRRDHVASAVSSIREKRSILLGVAERDLFSLTSGNADANKKIREHIDLLGTVLSRTSDELRIVSEFQREQLKSLLLPPHVRFVLWMTAQNEAFFRGGRAASERLSAARIGEKMLSNGIQRVPPCGGMWPLLCHEVALSYDQEERLRSFQRELLTDKESWLDRHTTRATGAVIQSSYRSINGLSEMIRSRENAVMDVLTLEQRVRFLTWAKRRASFVSKVMKRVSIPSSPSSVMPKFKLDDSLQPSPHRHVAANLYILDRNLQGVQSMLPLVPSLVRRDMVKKLSRRPSFESLGSHMNSSSKVSPLCSSSTNSVSSVSRRKRSHSGDGACSISALTGYPAGKSSGEGGGVTSLPPITPESAQAAAAQLVANALSMIGIALKAFPTQQKRRQRTAKLHAHQQGFLLQPSCDERPLYALPPAPATMAVVPSPKPESVINPNKSVLHNNQAPQQLTPPRAAPAGYLITVPIAPSGTMDFHTRASSGHRREMSLLNSPLPSAQEDLFMNIVPEESESDRIINELADGDWAIGGFDKQT